VNTTSRYWGRANVYVLGKHPDIDNTDYFLCSLKAGITSICSTRYNASSSGLTLEALCGKDATEMAYMKKHLDAPELQDKVDWRYTADDLLRIVGLNMDNVNGNTSTSRVLTQLQLKETQLNTTLPSPAEALISLALCTTLDLAKGVPFVPFYVRYVPFFLISSHFTDVNV
jgi:hypothetical protein